MCGGKLLGEMLDGQLERWAGKQTKGPVCSAQCAVLIDIGREARARVGGVPGTDVHEVATDE